MSFVRELKRRNVFRVGIAYLIAAWLVLQVFDVVAPILEIPPVFGRVVLMLLAVGFVVSLFVAWAWELTPEGIKREKDVDRSRSMTQVTGRKLDFVIIGFLSVAVIFFALDKFVWTRADAPALERSIAVLPFENRSADESDVYFVDGIHDDILTQLSRLSGLDKVISRTSVERYRDADLSTPEIAAELGVAVILEGGVQRAGNTVRITVQLIDAANDNHLWAGNYDRELTTGNVFAIQSEIAIAIADSLRATLTQDEADDLAVLPTDSLAAYEAYQLGRFALRPRSLDGFARAIEYFQEAVRVDPEFALAHVGLADAYNLQIVWGFGADGSGYSKATTVAKAVKATAAANRALEINSRLGEAYAALGYTEFQLSTLREYGAASVVKADDFHRQAHRYAPNYADNYRWHAQILWRRPLNRRAEALAMAEKAVELDPLLGVNHGVLGEAYEVHGRLDDALTSYQRAVELSPALIFNIGQSAHALFAHGEYARAIVLGRRAADRGQGSHYLYNFIALSYRVLGNPDQFRRWSGLAYEFDSRFFSDELSAISAVWDRDDARAAEFFNATLDEWYDHWASIHQLAHIYSRTENPEKVLQFVREIAPPLLDRASPEVWPQSAMITAAAAQALIESGDEAHAAKIVELGLAVSREGVKHAGAGYGVEVAEIELLTLRGRHREALEALTRAVDAGYRTPFWLELSHFLDPLREEPEFIAAMDVIRADIAVQAAQLEDMERNGELPPSP